MEEREIDLIKEEVEQDLLEIQNLQKDEEAARTRLANQFRSKVLEYSFLEEIFKRYEMYFIHPDYEVATHKGPIMAATESGVIYLNTDNSIAELFIDKGENNQQKINIEDFVEDYYVPKALKGVNTLQNQLKESKSTLKRSIEDKNEQRDQASR